MASGSKAPLREWTTTVLCEPAAATVVLVSELSPHAPTASATPRRQERAATGRPAVNARAPVGDGGRQAQGELRAPAVRCEPQFAVHPQGQLASDREAEPGAAHAVARIKAVEDSCPRLRVDTGAVIGDHQARGPVPAPSLDRDGGSLRRVRERIVDQDTHDLRHPIGVGQGHCDTVAVDVDWGPVTLGGRPELLRGPPREVAQVDPLGVDLERVGVELREVQQVGGELREPGHLLAHRPHELRPAPRDPARPRRAARRTLPARRSASAARGRRWR